ncbi:hypothetical protein ACFFP0_01515 [Rhizobium puerariae]|uniref:Uncharacterized protein n=1 Tax=Rhizobium puerariae TaxID=1585791 RepID=A0ABV6AA54_9HYPH
MSITRLLSDADPDMIVTGLAVWLEPSACGNVYLRFYPFGGLLRETIEWTTRLAG